MNNEPLYFTAVTDQEVLDKVGISTFQLLGKFLSKNLSLGDYGSTVKGISFIFIMVDPDTGFHEESIEFLRKDKNILVAHRLPGIQVKQASSRKEIMQLMASAYLASIEKYPALKLRDFDHRRFRQDVQQLFEKKGWLVGQEA